MHFRQLRDASDRADGPGALLLDEVQAGRDDGARLGRGLLRQRGQVQLQRHRRRQAEAHDRLLHVAAKVHRRSGKLTVLNIGRSYTLTNPVKLIKLRRCNLRVQIRNAALTEMLLHPVKRKMQNK